MISTVVNNRHSDDSNVERMDAMSGTPYSVLLIRRFVLLMPCAMLLIRSVELFEL